MAVCLQEGVQIYHKGFPKSTKKASEDVLRTLLLTTKIFTWSMTEPLVLEGYHSVPTEQCADGHC